MDEDEWLARDLPVGIDMRGDKTQYLLSCPYEGSVALPLNDKAPVTDEEWAEALKTYGRDRDQANWAPKIRPNSLDPGLSSASANAPLDQFTNRHIEEEFQKCPLDEKSTAMEYSSSVESDGLPKYKPWGNSLSRVHPANQFASANGKDGEVGNCPSDPDRVGRLPDDLALPRQARRQSKREERTGDEERARLRAHYEKEGWLCPPIPAKATLHRIKRAVQHLGLNTDDEYTLERRTIMSRYALLAAQIFQCPLASVCLLRDGKEVCYGPDPSIEPFSKDFQLSAAGFAILEEEHQCNVVADMGQDWRFRKNPIRALYPGAFWAAAPLRFRRGDTVTTVGVLRVINAQPRTEFCGRNRDMLLNLANMLVYQLATLQSEINAKRTSSMYEASLSYLRRGVFRGQPGAETRSVKKRKSENKSASESGLPRKPDDPAAEPKRVRRPSKASLPSKIPPPMLSADGPSDDNDIAVKRVTKDSSGRSNWTSGVSRELFDDAAATYQRLFHAEAVAIIPLTDYQIFVRNSTSQPHDRHRKPPSKSALLSSFLTGKGWPRDVDCIVHNSSTEMFPKIQPLAEARGKTAFNFSQLGTHNTLAQAIQQYIVNRRVWYDREDPDDTVGQAVMSLMPSNCNTAFSSTFMHQSGGLKFAVLIGWTKQPEEFAGVSVTTMPIAWILGGCLMAALAVNQVRSLESSQVNYSNLQAHELRTPLHQILAVTQLLRSAMIDLADTPTDPDNYSTSAEQVRDLLPLLDAIDTSGKTLHGIIDNLLSFLDLKDKDAATGQRPSLLVSPSGATQSLETMFEELISDAAEEDKRSRRATGQPASRIETVFEIIPPLLGEQVMEDSGGALRRAISKILSNAYKFIDDDGCVEIYVDDAPGCRAPDGCEDLASTKRISILIRDNGHGMDQEFVREKLGEPWAKEDQFTAGSGLSVHLAFRIIELLGGTMEVSSAPGRGCSVFVEVDVPRRSLSIPSSPQTSLDSPGMSNYSPELQTSARLGDHPDNLHIDRKVALIGFQSQKVTDGVGELGHCLERQYKKLGCAIVDLDEAELVIAHGHIEENEDGVDVLTKTPARDIVFLVGEEHEAHSAVREAEIRSRKEVRRFRKPATPSILRESLFPGQAKDIHAMMPHSNANRKASITAPESVDSHGHEQTERPKAHFEESPTPESAPQSSGFKWSTIWKPRGMCIEEAVANLCLGDYMNSRRHSLLKRTPSNSSRASGDSGAPSTPNPGSETTADTSIVTSPMEDDLSRETSPSITDVEPEEPVLPTKVLIVEDNMVNRKLLVRMLSKKLPKGEEAVIEVAEAEDGRAAVEAFREFSAPAIVLLDINMPKMDGYQACVEMRALEKEVAARGRSYIMAVTALAGDAEKRRGLVESGMDRWLTKPCDRNTITKAVEDARQILQEARSRA